jgi:hypothetical protein
MTESLPHKTMNALERVWCAERAESLPYQSDGVIYLALCDEGLLERITVNEVSPHTLKPTAVHGFGLSAAGRALIERRHRAYRRPKVIKSNFEPKKPVPKQF